MSDTKIYVANWLVKHNKNRFKSGSELELTTKQAKPLLASGSVTLKSDVKDDSMTQASLEVEQLQQVITAIKALDLTDKSILTGEGIPTTAVLTDQCGFNVSAEMRDNAWTFVEDK